MLVELQVLFFSFKSEVGAAALVCELICHSDPPYSKVVFQWYIYCQL